VVEVFEKWTFLKCPKMKKGRSLFSEKMKKSILQGIAVNFDFFEKCYLHIFFIEK
jgi:hypothetical protein